MSHTPGPWKVGGKKTISRDHPDKSMQVIVARADSPDTARLIAAAPELLEAARGLLRLLNPTPGHPDETIAAARAAIAKATA